jgi:hypothetical protein
MCRNPIVRTLLSLRRGEGRRNGWVLGAKICDDLSDLRVGERIAEGGHLLPAVENLIGDLGRGPELVFAQSGEDGPFFAACAANSVAVGATLISKQDSSGLLGGLGFGAKDGAGVERSEKQDCRHQG